MVDPQANSASLPQEKNSDKKLRKVFYDIVKHETRGKVHVESDGRHRSIVRSERDPVLILCPNLEGSWFVVPKPAAPDTVGYWPKYTKFPSPAEVTHAPSDDKKLMPIKFLYYIEDELLKSFLAPTKLTDKNGNLWLNPEVFSSVAFHVPSSNICSWLDRSLRAQLLDSLVTDELIDMTNKLIDVALDIPNNNPNTDPKEITDLILDILELINTSVILSAASNLRGRHTTLTSIVKNKLILRDEVLKVHSGGVGSLVTKAVLRGSSFFVAELFWPLPNSLLTRCAHSS